MRIWLALLALLGPGLAQTQRWTGQAEYRSIPGVSTAAGAALDRSYTLVYPAQGNPRGTIVFVPGLLGGATNFDALARRLVLASPGWSVWSWDRRANGLEDRRGFSTADPWAYYRNYTFPDFPFLRDWGLKVHLEDLERVVEQARSFGPVVLAGHSLGASLASLFALYRGEKISGLILLDGAPRFVSLTREQYLAGTDGGFGRLAGLNDLLEGRTTPYINAFGLNPAGFAQAEAQAFMTALDPQADAPPGWVPFRASRLAAALYRVDERYALSPVFAVSVGQSTGREGISLLSFVVGSVVYTIRGPRGGRVEWRDNGEATDPLEFVTMYANPTTGFSEWFFPYRLLLDISAYEVVMPELKPRPLPYPVLALGAGRGLLPQENNFRGLSEFFPNTRTDIRILPNLTHLDILTSRRGDAVGPIAAYLRAIP
jgi:pimeloyl-ACP methyl ester carboxylesterase